MFLLMNQEENIKMILFSIIILPVILLLDFIIKKIKEHKEKKKKGF